MDICFDGISPEFRGFPTYFGEDEPKSPAVYSQPHFRPRQKSITILTYIYRTKLILAPIESQDSRLSIGSFFFFFGGFDRLISVGLPDAIGREDILKLHAAKIGDPPSPEP